MAHARNNKRSERAATVAAGGVDELSEKQQQQQHQHDDYDESLKYRCPGTMDILSGRMVPCSAAPTLREIALGRRMRRTIVDAPECQPSDQTRLPRYSKIHNVEGSGEKYDEECSCRWEKNNSKSRPEFMDEIEINIYEQTSEPCCTRKRKIVNKGRCVTFDG